MLLLFDREGQFLPIDAAAGDTFSRGIETLEMGKNRVRHIALENVTSRRFGERATVRESPRKPIAPREIEVSHRSVQFRASEQTLLAR